MSLHQRIFHNLFTMIGNHCEYFFVAVEKLKRTYFDDDFDVEIKNLPVTQLQDLMNVKH